VVATSECGEKCKALILQYALEMRNVSRVGLAPKRPLSERISDGLSGLLRVLFWLGLAYTASVVLSRYTRSVDMPNGAILAYRPDLTYEKRIYLFRPDGFRAVISNIERLCYNDRAIWVTTFDDKGFIWPSLEAEPLETRSTRFNQVLAGTGLDTEKYYCNGYYRRFLGAGLLISGDCPVIPNLHGKSLQGFGESLCGPVSNSIAPPKDRASATP
jgi:hypothetical protein